MKRHEDHRYLLALRDKNPVLVRELYQKFSPQVIQWVKKNNGSIDDAQDVFQEALIALYNMSLNVDFVLTYPIGGLIFRICRNKWIDKLREKNREAEVRDEQKKRYTDEQDIVPPIEQIEEEEIRQKKLNLSFQQLSSLCQQLLRLTSNGTSPKDIAIQLEMANANTVYRRKSACIDRWRKLYHA